MIEVFILFLISAVGTYYVMPHSIRKLKENNFVVYDMYKYKKTMIPTNAGMIVLFISMTEPSGIGISLNLAKLSCSAGNPTVPDTPVLNNGTPDLIQETKTNVENIIKQTKILIII